MTPPNWKWPLNLGFPSVIQKVKTEGVLTPLLWLCGLSFIATLVAAALDSNIAWAFVAISTLSAGAVIYNFHYFRSRDPAKLQSEKFQLEYQKQLALQQGMKTIEHESMKNPLLHGGQKEQDHVEQ